MQRKNMFDLEKKKGGAAIKKNLILKAFCVHCISSFFFPSFFKNFNKIKINK